MTWENWSRAFSLSSDQSGRVTKIAKTSVRIKAVGGEEWWYEYPALRNMSLGLGCKVKLTKKYEEIRDAASGPLKPGKLTILFLVFAGALS